MIKLDHITKTYTAGDAVVSALNNVSITFREKEFVSILGPSGCGKTTLLNILGGLDRYDSGDICVNNISTKNFKDKDWDAYRNHYIGFVFQNYNLIPHLNVVENVELALSIGGIGKKEKRKRALDALSQVGLSSQAKKRPNQLSGGQMQRVAIARAIVNNPEIILADEPTGALDSETSVQVMEILKEISKKHLVIMVTHNKELAETYSTRIINLLDGKMVGDSKPYNPKTKESKQKTNKKPKSAMSILTAFALSFKNLFTKKTKTLLVSFAGSIGIIGIALVLAVSSGFTGYINKLQSDTLSGYPISVSTVSVNLNSLTSGFMGDGETKLEDFPNDKHIVVKDSLARLTLFSKYNYLSPNFIEYIRKYEEQDNKKDKDKQNLNTISYSFESPLHILSKNGDNIKFLDNKISNSTFSGTTTSNFYEGLSSKEFIESQYDVLYGKYPSNKNEVALVISSNNSLSVSLLNALDFNLETTDGKYDNIDFSTIVGENGKTYKIVTNDSYYVPVYDGETITGFTTNTNLNEMYTNSSIELKISAILRVKPSSPLSVYGNGIVYLPELTEYINTLEQNSLIVQEQRKQTEKMFVPYVFNIAELNMAQPFTTISSMKSFVKNQYNVELTTEQCNEYVLQNLSASTIPVAIRFYPKSFDSKDNIISYINAWNLTEEGKNNTIQISDATELLSSTLGQLVDIISYVLIAFAGVSLIVSSIMIGIITYTSVIERTKEIGVLRSIGARKRDISRVFNMETFIIGLTSGILGVLITFALTFPISALFKMLGGSAITTNMAVLRVEYMVLLTVVSVILTLIAGLIPARLASKKDPVKALRTE